MHATEFCIEGIGKLVAEFSQQFYCLRRRKDLFLSKIMSGMGISPTTRTELNALLGMENREKMFHRWRAESGAES